MKAVIFKKQYGPYNVGVVAGFPDAAADRLITSKVAALYTSQSNVPVKRDGFLNKMVRKTPGKAK